MSVAKITRTNASSVVVPANRTHTSKYCDVCYGVGKSFEEYTSHFVKSSVGPDGVVTCPTILNSICSYCKSKGHFKSGCDVLKKKTAAAAAEKKKTELIQRVKEHTTKKRGRSGNIINNTKSFDCLRSDSEASDDEDDDARDTDFPPMCPPPLIRTNPHNSVPIAGWVCNTTTTNKKMSYVDALESAIKTFPAAAACSAAATAAAVVPSGIAHSNNSTGVSLLAYINNKAPPNVCVRARKVKSAVAAAADATTTPRIKKSWADYSTSDSESGSDDDDE